MILKKKMNVVLNKKGLISTTQLNVPGKAIKLLGVNEENKNIDFKFKDDKVTVTLNKNGENSFISQKIGNSQLYRLTINKEIAEKMGITKEDNEVILEFDAENLVIKREANENESEIETRIISIINFKGGVGKTTTSHSLGAGLSSKGKKILLIDMDPQASLTFMTFDEVPKLTVKDIIVDGKDINKTITKTEEFDIIPSNLVLNLAERQLHSKFGAEKLLKKALEKIVTAYHYIIIDCPPSMNLFTVNALYASDGVIIPCETELLALDGLNLLIQTLEQTEEELDIKIKNTVVLPTKLDMRKKLSKEIAEHLKENFKTTNSLIRTSSKLNLLGLSKKSIYEIDSSSTASRDYMDLVEEVMEWDF